MSKTRPKIQAKSVVNPWPMVRLGDVCDEIKDRIQSSKVAVSEYVTTDNMVKDRGGIVQTEYVPSDVGLVEYHKGDVLVANIRPYLKKIWLADHDGGCSSDVVVFRTNTDGLSSEYLYSVLSQDAYFEYVMQKPRGTKMPRGDRDWMKEFRFPLPSLSEQREIVARLERELAAVEKMKKGFEALAETAKAEFKAELKEVFEGLKLCAETCKLGSLCKIKAGKKDVRQGNPHGEFPFFTCAKTCTFADTYSYDCAALLVAGNGDVGYTQKYVGKFEVYQRTYVLYDFKNVDIDFVYYLMAGEFQEWAYSKLMGNTMPYIKMGVLSEFQVPVPSPFVQHHTVSCLAEAKAHAEFLEAKAREGVAVCETMRKAILKEAFQ